MRFEMFLFYNVCIAFIWLYTLPTI